MANQEILLETGTNEFEMLEFYIDEKASGKDGPDRMFFGMNVAKVVEVIQSPGFSEESYGDNPCFLGTIPLRDLILPVVDMSVWLGIDRHKVPYENIVVTQFSNSVQGFLVSGVVEIHRLTWKELIPVWSKYYFLSKSCGLIIIFLVKHEKMAINQDFALNIPSDLYWLSNYSTILKIPLANEVTHRPANPRHY